MRVQFDDDGSLDEFVAENASIHFERMDECAWWMCVDLPDGDSWHINVGAKNARAKGFSTAESNGLGRWSRGELTDIQETAERKWAALSDLISD